MWVSHIAAKAPLCLAKPLSGTPWKKQEAEVGLDIGVACLIRGLVLVVSKTCVEGTTLEKLRLRPEKRSAGSKLTSSLWRSASGESGVGFLQRLTFSLVRMSLE